MEAFPSPLEHTVATALLLLSSFSSFSSDDELSRGVFDSSSSDLTSDSYCGRIGEDPLLFLAMAAYNLDRKLKIVRKRRSKTYSISDRQRIICASKKKPRLSAMEPKTKEVSVLLSSSSSSAVSDGRSWHQMRMGRSYWKYDKVGPRRKHSPAESIRLRVRGEAILKLLSVGCASEVRIRAVLGDSPDTSKALRLLLKLEEVKRSGAGGRTDPFLYAVARPRSDVDSA